MAHYKLVTATAPALAACTKQVSIQGRNPEQGPERTDCAHWPPAAGRACAGASVCEWTLVVGGGHHASYEDHSLRQVSGAGPTPGRKSRSCQHLSFFSCCCDKLAELSLAGLPGTHPTVGWRSLAAPDPWEWDTDWRVWVTGVPWPASGEAGVGPRLSGGAPASPRLPALHLCESSPDLHMALVKGSAS